MFLPDIFCSRSVFSSSPILRREEKLLTFLGLGFSLIGQFSQGKVILQNFCFLVSFIQVFIVLSSFSFHSISQPKHSQLNTKLGLKKHRASRPRRANKLCEFPNVRKQGSSTQPVDFTSLESNKRMSNIIFIKKKKKNNENKIKQNKTKKKRINL